MNDPLIRTIRDTMLDIMLDLVRKADELLVASEHQPEMRDRLIEVRGEVEETFWQAAELFELAENPEGVK